MGVNSASLEQLKKHWDGLRTQAAQDLKPEVAEPRPAETGEVSLSPSAKLARKVQEEQAKKVEEDKARMVQEGRAHAQDAPFNAGLRFYLLYLHGEQSAGAR